MRVPTILRDQWRATAREHPALEGQLDHYTLALSRHGDIGRWMDAVDAMPSLRPSQLELGPTVTIGAPADATSTQRRQLALALKTLQPWRKGPWSVCGLPIDCEWRSNLKWQRVHAHIEPLGERRVLDVGCGNGYYGWRMCGAGANSVTGIDPTAVYVMQHAVLSRWIAAVDESTALRNRVLPVRLEELDATVPFDTVLSMGVLYHRRDPLVHLEALRERLRPGGELVLETLILDNDRPCVLEPPERYARMRNVWHIPSTATLIGWLEAAGFSEPRIVDITATTPDEQRSTDWMPFESLINALDPSNPSLTIEGHPAPLRAVLVARA